MSTRMPTKVKIVLLGNTLSAIGNGLVLPYLFIYLHNVRGISAGYSGMIIGYGALASLIFSPLVGHQIDHWGPKPVILVSLLILTVGYASLSLVHSIPMALFTTTICAMGNTGMWPAQSAILAELTPDHLREKVFASSFAALNVGIGIGGLIASTFVTISKPKTFEWLMIGDGLTYLFYFVAVLVLREAGHRTKVQRAANKELEGGWKDVIADRVFVKFWIIGFLAILFGYSQLEVGFAAFATSVGKVSPSHLAYAYAANTALIASCQLWIVKKIEKVRRGKAMAIAAFFWMGAWVALSFAGILPAQGLIFVILCQVIFSWGEMFWSPVIPAVINQLAPDHLRGRYNAAGTNAWQIASIIGPSFAGVMLGAHLHWLWIGLLVGGLAVVSLGALRLKLPEREVAVDPRVLDVAADSPEGLSSI